MYAFIKCVSYAQQKILFEMIDNGKKINFNQQKVFNNRISFNKALNDLVKRKLVKRKLIKEKGGFQNEYTLNWNGEALIELLK